MAVEPEPRAPSSDPETLAGTFTARKSELADLMLEALFRAKPALKANYPPAAVHHARQDLQYNLEYLAQAVALGRVVLFSEYVGWLRAVLEARKVPPEDLILTLEVMEQVLRDELGTEPATQLDPYFTAGREAVREANPYVKSVLDENDPRGKLARAYLDLLLHGDRGAASRLLLDAVESGMPLKEIYLHVFQPVQHEVGRLWMTNEISVAQEHYCTAVTQLVASQLYPYLFDTPKNGYRLVATCVGGELHELGVRVVADFFEADGWDTYYLGANTPTPSVLAMLREIDADVLALSATMLVHVVEVQRLIREVRARPDISTKILVGGYPFNLEPDLWKVVGADGWAPDAENAVRVARDLIETGASTG